MTRRNYCEIKIYYRDIEKDPGEKVEFPEKKNIKKDLGGSRGSNRDILLKIMYSSLENQQ